MESIGNLYIYTILPVIRPDYTVSEKRITVQILHDVSIDDAGLIKRTMQGTHSGAAYFNFVFKPHPIYL